MFSDITGFDWDEGNLLKNWEKHGVSHLEAEQIFFNEPILVHEDPRHSQDEPRWFVLGQTDEHRFLMVVFTRRGEKLRIISARDMRKKKE